jgi:hypothetical protein
VVFARNASDVNASLLEGYTEALAAALGIPGSRITVSVATAGGGGRRLLGRAGAAHGVTVLVVVRVADYAEAMAVMGFAMTQSALYAATRAPRLPDLEFIPDSVVYTDGRARTTAAQTTAAQTITVSDTPDRGGRRRAGGWGALGLLVGVLLCH